MTTPRSILAMAIAAAAAMSGGNVLSAGERHMQELFNSGGPGWMSYPGWGRKRSGVAAAKRAARKRRNVRARVSKR